MNANIHVHDKDRFTVILPAVVNGRKLKAFLVFKEVRIIPKLNLVPRVVTGGSSELKCLDK